MVRAIRIGVNLFLVCSWMPAQLHPDALSRERTRSGVVLLDRPTHVGLCAQFRPFEHSFSRPHSGYSWAYRRIVKLGDK